MSKLKSAVRLAVVLLIAMPYWAFALSHREALITALDHTADISDVYASVSYDHLGRGKFVLNGDLFLQPSNGPNYAPFDRFIMYPINSYNNWKARGDITLQFRFQAYILDAELPVAYVGEGIGVDAQPNSPSQVKSSTPFVPRAITSLIGDGAEGLSPQETLAVEMVKGDRQIALTIAICVPLIAVSSKEDPCSMPDYSSLASSFDSLNFRARIGTEELNPAEDGKDQLISALHLVAGFRVNSMAVEVPIGLLTRDGAIHAAIDPKGAIGAWARTFRREIAILKSPWPAESFGRLAQIQRVGNPSINGLMISIGSKDFWSMSEPVKDTQFASFDLDPLIRRDFHAVYEFKIPTPPRTDLLSLVTYAVPIASKGTPARPTADIMRLNTEVSPTRKSEFRSLGLMATDAARFIDRCRLTDAAVDIVERVGVGGLLNAGFNVAPSNLLGDGVTARVVPLQETSLYVHYECSGWQIIPGDHSGWGNKPKATSTLNLDPSPSNQGGSASCPVDKLVLM